MWWPQNSAYKQLCGHLSCHFEFVAPYMSQMLFYMLQVWEIVSILDLDVIFYPSPQNGPNFLPKVAAMGGKQQFPYMVRILYLFLFYHLVLLSLKWEMSWKIVSYYINDRFLAVFELLKRIILFKTWLFIFVMAQLLRLFML